MRDYCCDHLVFPVRVVYSCPSWYRDRFEIMHRFGPEPSSLCYLPDHCQNPLPISETVTGLLPRLPRKDPVVIYIHIFRATIHATGTQQAAFGLSSVQSCLLRIMNCECRPDTNSQVDDPPTVNSVMIQWWIWAIKFGMQLWIYWTFPLFVKPCTRSPASQGH